MDRFAINPAIRRTDEFEAAVLSDVVTWFDQWEGSHHAYTYDRTHRSTLLG